VTFETAGVRGRGAALLLALFVSASPAVPFPAQTPIDVDELALYRLTPEVFSQFDEASRAIAAASRTDPALMQNPLFTREIVLSDDAVAAATALETRLQAHAVLVRALREAKLSAREYTKFALTLFAARMAHGFVKAGVLRGVPDGAASANVAFVQKHEKEITALLAILGLDG
jgi:hypothetical protein